MAAYAQRTDLSVAVPKSKTYGDAADSRRRQQAVPIGTGTPPPPQPQPQRPVAPQQPIIPLGEPTRYPDEPITTGANFGAGLGARAAGIPVIPATGGVRELLIYLNSQFPNSDIENLLSTLMDD